jgi:signal transduction histidine kinase
MIPFSKNSIARNVIHRVPLQAILIVPFVLQIFATVGIVGYLSYKNGQRAVNDLATQLETEVGGKIKQNVEIFLDTAQNSHDVFAASIESGTVDTQNFAQLEHEFWHQLKYGLVPDLFFANPQGDLIGVQLEDGEATTRVKDRSTGNNRHKYLLDDRGNRIKLVQTRAYNTLDRPWYKAAIRGTQPTWSAVYPSTNLLFPEISAVRPIYDKSGNLLGVLGSEMTLEQISNFLGNLKISASGQAFIIERNGELIASSTAEAPFIIEEHGKDKFEKRILASNSINPLTQATAKQLLNQFGSLEQIKQRQHFTFQLNGELQIVQVEPFQDGRGIDWLIAIVIPESDFMGQINANTRTTILLCAIALGLAIILGIYTSHWIAQPILELNQASKAIAEGNLDRQVADNPIRELNTVGQSFNHMANQLQASFSALERSNAELEYRVTERTQELSEKNTQLNAALEELHRTQTQMIQTEKMSALGQMVAGVAHEINNPVNFIHGNLEHIKTYAGDLLYLVQTYQQYLPNPPQTIQELIQAIDLTFLSEDLPNILRSMEVGTDRIREIVLSLRNFSRLDEAEFKAVDLHEGIDNTLMILRHRFQATADRPAIQVIKEYGTLPKIECYAGQLNQVFLNLLSNAIDALEEANQKLTFTEIDADRNTIWIHTAVETGDRVKVTISDNGNGIAEKVRSHLFDPFFTTKPVGKGTGLGLSISYQIVTEKHKGKLWCDSIIGEGTKFCLEIPVRQIR